MQMMELALTEMFVLLAFLMCDTYLTPHYIQNVNSIHGIENMYWLYIISIFNFEKANLGISRRMNARKLTQLSYAFLGLKDM